MTPPAESVASFAKSLSSSNINVNVNVTDDTVELSGSVPNQSDKLTTRTVNDDKLIVK